MMNISVGVCLLAYLENQTTNFLCMFSVAVAHCC